MRFSRLLFLSFFFFTTGVREQNPQCTSDESVYTINTAKMLLFTFHNVGICHCCRTGHCLTALLSAFLALLSVNTADPCYPWKCGPTAERNVGNPTHLVSGAGLGDVR